MAIIRICALTLWISVTSNPLFSQSFVAFQQLESCTEWECVVALLPVTALRLDRSIPWRLPLRAESARLSSAFGYRVHPVEGTRKFHGGVDIAAPLGTHVVAAGAGRVSTGSNRLLGKFVRIDHLNGFTSTYGHLSRITVRGGTTITQGMVVGTVGMTGRTTGPHLHWTVKYKDRQVDPLIVRRAVFAAL